MRASYAVACAALAFAGGSALAQTDSAQSGTMVVDRVHSASNTPTSRNPQIDFPGFVELAADVQATREERLLSLTAFRALAEEPGTLLLDARSAAAFAEGHMDGAINLPLPDFTAASLATLIGPDSNRTILIYCNNNFTNDVRPVVRKIVTVALNIQTMINLNAYGYTNVYELGEAVDLTESLVDWTASEAHDGA